MNDKLTGRVRVRGGWFGKIVVQVEIVKEYAGAVGGAWRDATVSDLSELHNLTYSRIDVTVRLPDIPMMAEPELLGELPIKRGKLH